MDFASELASKIGGAAVPVPKQAEDDDQSVTTNTKSSKSGNPSWFKHILLVNTKGLGVAKLRCKPSPK